jgi:ADP-ribosylglycohydrolase
MLPSLTLLRRLLAHVIHDKTQQGHDTAGMTERLAGLTDSYDTLARFAQELSHLPMRSDWPYVEPSDWADIQAESDPDRPLGPLGPVDLADSARRVAAAFEASVCGCILGKPLEINPTLEQLRTALSAIGDWPLNDYVSDRLAPHLQRTLHPSWNVATREHIRYATHDDDINYTVMGMLNLEEHGLHFTPSQLRNLWLRQLPIATTFGPERMLLIKAGASSLVSADDWDPQQSVRVLNPKDEYCGALIRADAYGYACPGQPALAAELACRDSGMTHRRTGIYGTIFVAAAIAAMQSLPPKGDPLDAFRVALQFVPRRSRFHRIVSDSLADVVAANDWLDGYQRIHGKYKEYSHCQVYQEVGTLINTLRFARDVGEGICMQVMQGNDTDSFGATAGSLLGCRFGPGHLERRWLTPFNDRIHLAMANFWEQSLSALTARMARLPALVAAQLQSQPGAHLRASGEAVYAAL